MHVTALAPIPAQRPAPQPGWLAPSGKPPPPHAGHRTPDEAQEVLARDWQACERQAILMGAFGVW